MNRLALGALYWTALSASLPPCQAETLAPEVQQAIDRGLEYLAAHQADDGSWQTESSGPNQLGVMSLAVLAFMANGHLGDGGRYAETANRGVDYLVRRAKPSGLLNIANSQHDMYNHGLSTMVLVEAYGMTGDARLRRVLENAVQLIIRCQGRQGGWTYQATPGTHDSSISVMQLLALRAARSVGFAIEAETIDRAHDYVRRCYRNQRFRYTPGGQATYALTASGTVSMLAAGRTAAVDPATAGGLETLGKETANASPGQTPYYYYATYYAALAAKLAGGDDYRRIYPPIVRTLMREQRRDGGWPAGGSTGPIMNTSVAVFVLSLPRDMLPLCYEETQ